METTAHNEEQAQAIIDALPHEKLAEVLANAGYVVKSKTDYETEVENAKKLADSEATKRNYTRVEQSVFEATGVAKKVGESVTDYQKRAFIEAKSAVNSKVIDTPSDSDADPWAIVKALRTEFATLKEETEKARIDAFKGKATGLIEGAFSTIKLAVQDDNELNTAREERKILFENFYEPKRTENGNIVWMSKKTGEALIDQLGEPMNPEAIIKKNHASWLAKEGNLQTGLGLKSKTGKAGNSWGSDISEINKNISEEAKRRNVDATRDADILKLKKEAYRAIGINL